MKRWVLAAVGLAACAGDEPAGVPQPPVEPGGFVCTSDEPTPAELPRLSRAQYEGALRDFVAAALRPDAVDPILAAVSSTLTLLPDDASSDHARLDQAVSQAHVDAQYHLAIAVAEAMTATGATREALMGSCASDADAGNDAACLDTLIRRLGLHAHRRPLGEDEVAFYRDEVFAPATGMDVAGVTDVVAAMLLAPNFLYRVEIEGQPVDGRADLHALSAYELAARLSFHLWNEPPDEALYAAAESGALLDDAGYASEVDRLLADPRAEATFDRFYAEWLWLDDLAPLDGQLGRPDYDAFVADTPPTPELRERVVEDALDLTRYVSWQSEGSFADLFLTDRSFARTADVAAIYGGAPLWQDGSEPPSLPAGSRAGILTRPAMLATGSIATHPVLRGREIRRRVLCEDMPPPPPGAMDELPELDPLLGERARMEALTEEPGSSCVGCHGRMNPLGYTLGGYDGLGRVRSEETLYGGDGSVLATLPIDTAAVAHIDVTDETVVRDGIELSERIAADPRAGACFARHAFRFAFARVEDEAADGCALEAIRGAIAEGTSLRRVFRDVVLSPAFRMRKVTP
jgi:hypothetical protein